MNANTQKQLFKIKYNDEIHRIRGSIQSYNDLLNAISERFEALQGYTLEYKDIDSDLVRINCEEDFQILLEEFEGKKAIKLFLTESEEKPAPVETAETEPTETPEVEKSESSENSSSEEEGEKRGKK